MPIVATTVAACLGLLLGLDSAAVGSLIAFGTAGIYVAFFLVALAALDRPPARDVGSRRARAPGRAGVVINASRSAGSRFETVNIAWPRTSLAPPGRAGLPGLGGRDRPRRDRGVGGAYLLVARPQRKLAGR